MKNGYCQLKKILIATVAVCFFASYGALAKELTNSIHPLLVALYIYGISITIFFFVFGFLPELKTLSIESRQHKWLFFCFCLFSGTLGPLTVLWSLTFTTATNAVLLANSYSFFYLFFSALLLKIWPKKIEVFGILILVLGILSILVDGHIWDLRFNSGDLLMILSQLFFCVGDFIYKIRLAKIHPHIAVLGRNSLAFMITGLLVWFWFPHLSLQLDSEILISLVLLAIFPILIAQLLWYRAVKIVQPVLLSSISLLTPVFGIFFASYFLGEELGLHHFIGLVLVILGLGIGQFEKAWHSMSWIADFFAMHHVVQENGNGSQRHWWQFWKGSL